MFFLTQPATEIPHLPAFTGEEIQNCKFEL